MLREQAKIGGSGSPDNQRDDLQQPAGITDPGWGRPAEEDRRDDQHAEHVPRPPDGQRLQCGGRNELRVSSRRWRRDRGREGARRRGEEEERAGLAGFLAGTGACHAAKQ